MKKNYAIIYLLSILPLLAGIAFFLFCGRSLDPSAVISIVKNPHAGGGGIAESLKHPFTVLLLQMLVVLTSAKVMGYLFQRIGQPSVIGETVAGILLGPSLLGLLFPQASQFLFPLTSLPNLQLISQVGLVLFMFVIGMELDLDILKNRAGEAIVISHVSIVFPYLLGVGTAYFLYPAYGPSNIPFIAYALFFGIAMSITAFPVLARILKERRMTKTPVGSMAIVCAAINDVTGWCILAVVIAIAKAGNVSGALMNIVLAIVYTVVMVFAIRPLLRLLSKRTGDLQGPFIAIVFITLLTSAFIAETIGIHALFGAFIAGAIMPTNLTLRKLFTERVEDVSVMLLLPLFFAFTGLRTQIGLLNSPAIWGIAAIVISVAVIGKLGGSTAAAKLVGQSWKDSLSIGALMNTRGLMELIILNIGYDLGILTPEIFTMMIFMALATTFMTGPALNLIERVYAKTV